MNARIILAFLVSVLPLAAIGQGFAGLGTVAEGFENPRPDYEITFPKDHAAHPNYRIEWWYLTANLQDENGRAFGVQWTLFRSALRPGQAAGWDNPQIWMGHAAVTSAQMHLTTERLERGGLGTAGVDANPFTAWIGNWQMASTGADLTPLSVSAYGEDFSYTLNLLADTPYVLNGDFGYSVKSPDGQASHYYSQPGYRASGTLSLPEGPVKVTGSAWLDREWSSQPLSAEQKGWDWFSLHFDTGSKLMGFRLRSSTGEFSSGTWINPDGTAEPLAPGEFIARPVEFAEGADSQIPVEWQVKVPAHNLAVTINALNPASWMDHSVTYWEGPVHASGSHSGVGYLEMTGYR